MNAIHFIFIGLSIVHTSGCVHFHELKPEQNLNQKITKVWSPLLDQLNTPPSEHSIAIKGNEHFDVELDLFSVNREGMQLIEQSWKDAAISFNHLAKRDFAIKKNEFFHLEVTKLNHQTIANFTRSLNGIAPVLPALDLVTKVLNTATNHPVAGTQYLSKLYRGGEIGYCFARALVVHKLLLDQGVSQDHIAKIFTIGDLRVEQQIWEFHVAIVVLTDRGVRVLDPLHGTPLELDTWLDINSSYDIKSPLSRVRFYLSDPRKFMPATGIYQNELFAIPSYGDFFLRLGQELQNPPSGPN